MTNRENNIGIYQNQEEVTQESFNKRALKRIKNAFNKVKLFAKAKPIIFSLICFCILSVIVVVIVVPIVVSKRKKKNTTETEEENTYEENNIVLINIQMNDCTKK